MKFVAKLMEHNQSEYHYGSESFQIFNQFSDIGKPINSFKSVIGLDHLKTVIYNLDFHFLTKFILYLLTW